VERASKLNEDSKFKQSEAQQGKDSVLPTSLMKDASVTRDVIEGSNFGSLPASEPIAPRLGVDYPFPPHLEYVYLSVLLKVSYLINIFVSTLESSALSVNAMDFLVMVDIDGTLFEACFFLFWCPLSRCLMLNFSSMRQVIGTGP
jgi:hypothetical protein